MIPKHYDELELVDTIENEKKLVKKYDVLELVDTVTDSFFGDIETRYDEIELIDDISFEETFENIESYDDSIELVDSVNNENLYSDIEVYEDKIELVDYLNEKSANLITDTIELNDFYFWNYELLKDSIRIDDSILNPNFEILHDVIELEIKENEENEKIVKYENLDDIIEFVDIATESEYLTDTIEIIDKLLESPNIKYENLDDTIELVDTYGYVYTDIIE